MDKGFPIVRYRMIKFNIFIAAVEKFFYAGIIPLDSAAKAFEFRTIAGKQFKAFLIDLMVHVPDQKNEALFAQNSLAFLLKGECGKSVKGLGHGDKINGSLPKPCILGASLYRVEARVAF